MSGRTPVSINTKKARKYDAIKMKRDNQAEDYNRIHDKGWDRLSFRERVRAMNAKPEPWQYGWFQRECERMGIA